MKKIPLTQGQFALIDDEDFEVVNKLKWFAAYQKDRNKYLVRNKDTMLHRMLLNVTDSKIQVDHINGNPLDNRRCNLRTCTNKQNMMNRFLQKNNTTGYKGVRKSGLKGFRATIQVNNKKINLGSYKTIKEAAIAYNNGALKYFGEFANLNRIT